MAAGVLFNFYQINFLTIFLTYLMLKVLWTPQAANSSLVSYRGTCPASTLPVSMPVPSPPLLINWFLMAESVR